MVYLPRNLRLTTGSGALDDSDFCELMLLSTEMGLQTVFGRLLTRSFIFQVRPQALQLRIPSSGGFLPTL